MTSTNLENLARIGQIDAVPVSQEQLSRMLKAAQQRLQDAKLEQLSAESRFDCAYNAIRIVADMALLSKGYRTPTSKPGHHQTSIQSLGLTLGIAESTIRILDSLRKQRNVTDYGGEPVSEGALMECIKQAELLFGTASKTIGRIN